MLTLAEPSGFRLLFCLLTSDSLGSRESYLGDSTKRSSSLSVLRMMTVLGSIVFS